MMKNGATTSRISDLTKNVIFWRRLGSKFGTRRFSTWRFRKSTPFGLILSKKIFFPIFLTTNLTINSKINPKINPKILNDALGRERSTRHAARASNSVNCRERELACVNCRERGVFLVAIKGLSGRHQGIIWVVS